VSERLSSNNKSKKSLATAVALGASVLALTGCYNQADSESGSSSVSKCPEGYIQSGDKPITSPTNFNSSLTKSINQLASILPRNTLGGARTQLIDLNKNEQALVEASKHIFYLKDNGFTEVIQVGDENKVDDASEQLCSGPNGSVFMSQRASQAIGAMESAGIDVRAVKSNIK